MTHFRSNVPRAIESFFNFILPFMVFALSRSNRMRACVLFQEELRHRQQTGQVRQHSEICLFVRVLGRVDSEVNLRP